MPRYFFDTDDGEREVRDETGIELSRDDVERETVALLRDLAHADIQVGEPRVLTAAVRDDEGSTLFRATMTLLIERPGSD